MGCAAGAASGSTIRSHHSLTELRRETGEKDMPNLVVTEEVHMISRLLGVLVIAAALFLTVRDTDSEVMAGAKTQTYSGLQVVDSVLQRGLSEDTHQAIADSVTDSTELATGLGDEFGKLTN